MAEKHYEKKIFVLASNGNAIDELFSPRIAVINDKFQAIPDRKIRLSPARASIAEAMIDT